MGKKLSFDDTLRLMDRKRQVHDRLEKLVFDNVFDSIKEANDKVNKAVYEMAERNGCSIWDICFSFVPEYSFVEPQLKIEGRDDFFIRAEGFVKLVPLELELTKGPDYWEAKYNQLKAEMQAVIDGKEEEDGD